ncbi:MAG: hypothetical protein LBH74_08065 [Nitrososphaerota archaeon]|jgi:hypothetical protein|nr:hypothetical protein [Nitrososphaerota archaeon]
MPPITIEEALGLVKAKETQNNQIQETQPLLTLKQYTVQQRRKQLAAHKLRGGTLVEFAREQGISEDTAQDDFAFLVRDGLGTALVEEWTSEYAQMKKTNRVLAFRALTDLIKKVLEKESKLAVTVQNTTNVQVNLSEQIKTLIDISERPCSNANPNPKEP